GGARVDRRGDDRGREGAGGVAAAGASPVAAVFVCSHARVTATGAPPTSGSLGPAPALAWVSRDERSPGPRSSAGPPSPSPWRRDTRASGYSKASRRIRPR